MVVKTKNFHPDTDPKLLCTCGHPKCHKPSVHQWVLDNVQKIRDDLNRPMLITSAARCKYHPYEIKKKTVGDHVKRTAVDVFCIDELTRNKLLVLAGRYGATRVAVGKNFVHLAWTNTADKSVPTWSY